EKRDEVGVAQTSDYLSGPWVASDSDLFPRSGVARTKRRQLDHVGFSRRSFLDLRHVDRYRHRLEFRCRPAVSEGRSIPNSLGFNGAWRGRNDFKWRRLRETAAHGDV